MVSGSFKKDPQGRTVETSTVTTDLTNIIHVCTFLHRVVGVHSNPLLYYTIHYIQYNRSIVNN